MAHHEKKRRRERTKEYLERADKTEIKHVDSEEETTRQLRASLARRTLVAK